LCVRIENRWYNFTGPEAQADTQKNSTLVSNVLNALMQKCCYKLNNCLLLNLPPKGIWACHPSNNLSVIVQFRKGSESLIELITNQFPRAWQSPTCERDARGLNHPLPMSTCAELHWGQQRPEANFCLPIRSSMACEDLSSNDWFLTSVQQTLM
jgi:hypothetical protein